MNALKNNSTYLGELPIIKVIGVGGAGKFALNRMINSGMANVKFIAIDFYDFCLADSKAHTKLVLEQIHVYWPEGEFGELNRECKHESALDGRKLISTAIGQADVVFIIAGMGGATGSATAPVVAEMAKETGALIIGVVTTPFNFEGQARQNLAWKGIDELNRLMDTLIIIPIEAIEKMDGDKKISVDEAFQTTDDYLCSGVQCLIDFIIGPYLHPDDDFVTPLLRSVTGKAITGNMGMGCASGEARAIKAAQMALSSPLLEKHFKNAPIVLFDCRVMPDCMLIEINNIADVIRDKSNPDANVIWETTLAQNPTSEIKVIILCLHHDSEDKTAV
jgi:cell division protein FtsZ